MNHKKILFLTQEMTPFLPSTALADFSKNIPEALQAAGLDLRVFAPRFGIINERRNQLHDVIRLSGINIVVNDTDHPLLVKVASLPGSHLQVYFVDNDEYFKHKSKFTPSTKYPSTNLERSLFFVRGALEAINKLRWIPDIIYCAGWFSAFAPLYLRTYYEDSPCLSNAKIIYATANEEDTGELGKNFHEMMAFDNIPEETLNPLYDAVTPENLRKLGIRHADGVCFVGNSRDELKEYADYAETLSKPMIVLPPEGDADAEIHKKFFLSLF